MRSTAHTQTIEPNRFAINTCIGSNGGSSPDRLKAWLKLNKSPCTATKLHGVANAAITIRSYQALPRTKRRYCIEVHIDIAPSISGSNQAKAWSMLQGQALEET